MQSMSRADIVTQTVAMDTAAHIAAVETENAALLAAARSGPLDTPVPSCPAWDVAALVGHLGSVHRWVLGWLETGGRTPLEQPPAGDAVLDWFEAGVPRLVDALRALEPTATAASFIGDQPATFWPRRQAHEAAIHRWDGERALDRAQPIDAPLAVDGVDEFFDTFLLQRLGRAVLTGSGETIHLHATDDGIEGGEWLLTLASDGVEVEHGHGKGDAAVRAPASDLVLFVWNRIDLDQLEVFGDAALLEQWRKSVSI
jgi:uncharacterized protein (TIGR03083 family)